MFSRQFLAQAAALLAAIGDGVHGGRRVRINPREADVTTPWAVGLACGAQQALEVVDKVIEFTPSEAFPSYRAQDHADD